jgi:RNA polymerase sigma-70 factor (ECF subfamily)
MTVLEDLRADWARALDGDDAAALRRLVHRLRPVVQARVARKLLVFRDRGAPGRDVRQEVEDLTQEVFLVLFADDARILRGWQAERGLSLENYVGLVAERQAVSLLRTKRRSPWSADPTLAGELERLDQLEAGAAEPSAERAAVARDTLGRLLDRLSQELSPLGRQLFELLLVDEVPMAEAAARTGLSSDALYTWRSRLRKLARRILGELSEPRPSARTSLGDSGR